MSELGTVVSRPIDQVEGQAILDKAARRLLGLTGDQFVTRWEAGDTDGMDHVAAMKVAMLIPLAR